MWRDIFSKVAVVAVCLTTYYFVAAGGFELLKLFSGVTIDEYGRIRAHGVLPFVIIIVGVVGTLLLSILTIIGSIGNVTYQGLRVGRVFDILRNPAGKIKIEKMVRRTKSFYRDDEDECVKYIFVVFQRSYIPFQWVEVERLLDVESAERAVNELIKDRNRIAASGLNAPRAGSQKLWEE